MRNPFTRSSYARELKQLALENNGEPLSVLDDVVFKAMLSANNDDSREALRSLLSACTRRPVAAVQILNNDLTPAHLDAKSARLDIHVTFNDGDVANLEMQASREDDELSSRSVFYSAMLLSGQQIKGKY